MKAILLIINEVVDFLVRNTVVLPFEFGANLRKWFRLLSV